MNELQKCVQSKDLVIFDLFHTLTANARTQSNNRLMTYEILEMDSKTWDFQILQNSPDRLIGKITDPFEIMADMARS